MKPSSRNNLNKILYDKQSGSTELLLKLIKWCKDNRSQKSRIKEMMNIAPSELATFTNIQTFINRLRIVIEENDDSTLKHFLDEEERIIKTGYDTLFENALPYLKNFKRIVTISNSKTVSEILIRLNKYHKIHVMIGESRPKLEGRILAKKLLKKNIEVTIITDALLMNEVEKSDAVVIGADQVLINGNIVNKIGSRSLAVLCKYFGKPFYVLTSGNKFSKRKNYTPEEKDRNEIWNYNHRLLRKINYYFEVIEKEFITGMITDEIKNQK